LRKKATLCRWGRSAWDRGALRLNIIDILVAAVILGLIALGAYKLFFVNPTFEAQNGLIEYQVLIENVRRPTVDSFSPNQRVRELQTNIELGTIVAKDFTPHKEPVPTLDGRIVLAEVPERYDLLVTIQSPAAVGESNITIGNREIKVGDKLSIKTSAAASSGVIYQVKVISR